MAVSRRRAPLSFEPDEVYESRTTTVLPLSQSDDDGGKARDAAGDAEPTAVDKASAASRKASAAREQSATEKQAPQARQLPYRPSQRVSTAGSGSGESRFSAGTMLTSRYRIVHLLGRGGMGEVYCAEDLELGQRVALKLLPKAWAQDCVRLERLRSEVRLARSVTHPNVCRVYDIGGDEGRRFLSMEYIDGEDLDALLRRIGRAPADMVTEIGIQICQGLAAIHDSGILHRDLKPANIMLDARGRVHISDFGLASVADEAAGKGMLQGTPAYMAPEQLSGQQVSIRSDLYALGLILHKLLTGKPAFAARTPTGLLKQRVESAPPPLSTLVTGIPPAIEVIITRCLAPDPLLRPASAREVAAALAGVAAPGQAVTLVVAVTSTGLDTASLAAQLDDDAVARLVQAHAGILDNLSQHHAGTRVRDTETPLVLFTHPGAAVQYALAYQHAVQALAQGESVALAIGVGIQLGVQPREVSEVTAATPRLKVNTATRDMAARLSKLAEPGQILLARSVFDLARQDAFRPPGKLQWLAHGSYELAGMAEPVEVCEVGIEGVAPLAPPRGSDLARRRPVQDVVTGWRPAPGMELPRRPHWIMEKKLGEGGFGEVWLATHATTHEPRVLKFCYDAGKLRALQREITLFRLLKETLGERDDIVRILEWNFEEAPYFIESAYTAGGNLMDWALDQGGLDAIPLETRLEIVAQVATALAAAHSVGVLHKDVKPGNVLMTGNGDGTARAQLGDFGIGAITQKQRLAEAGIPAMGLTMDVRTNMAAAPEGTRLYMAPETLEGKPATIQADIYALGVMLYQIVVGDLARALAPGWERDIADELLRAAVAAAVDGDPVRRLADAGQLAERLRTLSERRQELARLQQQRAERERRQEEAERALAALAQARRRRKVMALVAAVFVLFAGTVAVQSLRIAREARAREAAARAAAVAGQTAQQVSGFLIALFEEADPYAAQGRDVTAREILDRGKTKIDVLADQPDVQATLMHVMGVVYGNIGLAQDSAALLEQAVEKRRKLYGSRHIAVADSMHALASILERKRDYAAAEQPARESLRLRRTLLGTAHLDTADSMAILSDVLVGRGKYREAESLYEEVLATRRNLLGSEHETIATTLLRIGMLHQHAERYGEASRRYRDALAMYRRLPGDHTLQIAKALYYLGLAHTAQDDFAAAEPLFTEALAMYIRILGEKHPDSAAVMYYLAHIYQRTGQLDRAETLLYEVLAIYRASTGEKTVTIASILSELAFLRKGRGDCGGAIAFSRESLAMYHDTLQGDHRLAANSLRNHALLLQVNGNHKEAEAYYRDSIAMYRRLQDPGIALAMLDLASLHLVTNEITQAGDLIERATDVLRRQRSERDWVYSHLDSIRGAYLAQIGEIEPAEKLLLHSYESLRQRHGEHRLYTNEALERLIAFYETQGRSERAGVHLSGLGQPIPSLKRCGGIADEKDRQ